MIPEQDPLELELESLPPPELPAALRGRIAQAINAEREADRAAVHGRWPVRRMLAGALAAAACVTVSVVWLHGRRPNPVAGRDQTVMVKENYQFATLAAYTRAAAESPDRLDSLLNADAARSLAPGSAREMRALGRSFDDLKP